MKRLFRKLHLWLSVPFGIVITLICFSGAMLVFEPELMQLTQPALFRVDNTGGKAIPLDTLAARVQASLPHDVAVTTITVYPDPAKAYRVALSKPHKAALYVDQYTGEIKGQYKRTPFFSAMFRLHRWLLGSRPDGDGIFWGKIIVGTSTLIFVIVLITGIVIWWPRTVKGLKNSLKIRVRNRRLWHGLHVAGGMYAIVLLLVMALTGLTWSFNWYRTGFYAIFGVETSQGGGKNGNGNRHGETISGNDKFRNWQTVYEELAAANPHNESISIGNGEAAVAGNHCGNTRGSDKYLYDVATGSVTSRTLYDDMPASGKIRGWIYSVHTGTFGGTATRILWFLASLLGATLPVTGYYLWIKRLRAKRRKCISA